MIHLFQTFIQNNPANITLYVLLLCLLTTERVAIPHIYGKLLDTIKSASFSNTGIWFGVLMLVFFLFQLFDLLVTYLDAQIMPPFEAFVRKHITGHIIQSHETDYMELDLGNVTSKLVRLPINLRALFGKVRTFLFAHVLGIIITACYLFYAHYSLGLILMSLGLD